MNTPEPSLSFDETLNRSLHALLHERQSLEACLEAYPQYAAQLKPLLQTALLTQRLKKPVMSEARVAALEERLMKAFPAAPAPLEETPPQPAVTRRPVLRFPAWMSRSAAIVALVVLAALGTGGGTVAASANSVPGETLYGVKRAWEELILFFASLIGRMEDMRLHLAHVRWEELEILSAREQLISDGVWQGFVRTFEAAYRDADQKRQSDLMLVLADVQALVNPAVLPETYQADLTAIFTQLQTVTPDPAQMVQSPATQEAAPTATLAPTRIEAPTQELLVASTPTALDVIVATATRTPTPSRTPTATSTPSGTPTPLTPLPSPTATYTRIPLSIPSATAVIPTAPGGNSPIEIPGPDGLPLPPDESGPESPDEGLPLGTIDPIVRPTMRSVYATQTALASGAEKSATPEMP